MEDNNKKNPWLINFVTNNEIRDDILVFILGLLVMWIFVKTNNKLSDGSFTRIIIATGAYITGSHVVKDINKNIKKYLSEKE